LASGNRCRNSLLDESDGRRPSRLSGQTGFQPVNASIKTEIRYGSTASPIKENIAQDYLNYPTGPLEQARRLFAM